MMIIFFSLSTLACCRLVHQISRFPFHLLSTRRLLLNLSLNRACITIIYLSCLTGVYFCLYLSNAGTSPTNGGGTTPTMTPGTPSTTNPGMTPTVFGNGISPSGSGSGFNDGSGGVGFNENRNLLLAVGLSLWLSVLFLWG